MQNYSANIPVQLVRSQFSCTTTNSIFSERELSLYAIARPSVSVMFVRPTQAVQIFRNISTALSTLAIHWKFHGDRPRGTPPPGELNTRGVAKYSDFGPIDGYISETVQDEVS